MNSKKWNFRKDMLGHYINGGSTKTFQDAEDRLNQLELENKIMKARLEAITKGLADETKNRKYLERENEYLKKKVLGFEPSDKFDRGVFL